MNKIKPVVDELNSASLLVFIASSTKDQYGKKICVHMYYQGGVSEISGLKY